VTIDKIVRLWKNSNKGFDLALVLPESKLHQIIIIRSKIQLPYMVIPYLVMFLKQKPLNRTCHVVHSFSVRQTLEATTCRSGEISPSPIPLPSLGSKRVTGVNLGGLGSIVKGVLESLQGLSLPPPTLCSAGSNGV